MMAVFIHLTRIIHSSFLVLFYMNSIIHFPYLNPEQQPPVSLLQLLLAALQISRMLLLFLQPLNVLH